MAELKDEGAVVSRLVGWGFSMLASEIDRVLTIDTNDVKPLLVELGSFYIRSRSGNEVHGWLTEVRDKAMGSTSP